LLSLGSGAPSDNHLSLQRDYVRVVRGPRENGQRPAIDALFRSAAREFGPRVIGVLLSGQLDCGTAGLLAIRARSGLAVVQDLAEATFPNMPSNALRRVQIDHVLSAKQIGLLLARLAGTPVADSRLDSPGPGIGGFARNPRLSPVTCPECHGTMVESEDEDLLRFKCHVGHAFSIDGLAAEQEHSVEAALWASLRALEESETVNKRMSERSDRSIAERFREKARAMRHHADTIRRILLSGKVLPSPVDEASESAGK
jgi:two-component system chemotaxis response regulator CheB